MGLISAIGLAAAGIGTGLQVYGQMEAAKAAEDAADYNAKIAEDQARVTEAEAHETTNRQRTEKRRAMAQARAQLAASGAALGEGTSMDLMLAMDNRLETQIQDTARRAQLEARALRQQANLSKYQGGQQRTALKVESFGTALGGAADFGAKYGRMKYRTGGTRNDTRI